MVYSKKWTKGTHQLSSQTSYPKRFHIQGKEPTSLGSTDPAHDIIQFRDVAVANGETFFTLHILSILSEKGKELVSTSSISKCFLRHQVNRNSECAYNEYGSMTNIFVSKWLPVRSIICEVTLAKTELRLIVISEDSQMDIENCLQKNCSISRWRAIQWERKENELYDVEKFLTFAWTEIPLRRVQGPI